MRNRLNVPVEQAEARIDRLVADGERLIAEAEAVVTRDGWEEWTHSFERWHKLGKAALATTFEATDEADEFERAATAGIFRQFGQTDDEKFVYQREAIGEALNTLRSIKERLEYAILSGSDSAEDRKDSESLIVSESGSVGDKVFVVHGRNTVARDGIFDFLRAIGLQPIDWSEAVRLTGKGSPYIGEVLDAAFDEAKAVVVLMTPDEVAYLRPEFAHKTDEPDLQPSGQPRPNVLFEAGMAVGRDADRTIMVQLGELREFSDIAGRHTIRLGSNSEARAEIAARLETAGCTIDLSGDSWKTAGDFTAPPSTDLEEPPLADITIPQPIYDDAASVTVTYTRKSGPGEGLLTLINDGAVDLNDLRFELPEEAGTSFHVFAELPIAVLPVGQSAGFLTARTFGTGSDHFELPITARTPDGRQVAMRAFVNLVT